MNFSVFGIFKGFIFYFILIFKILDRTGSDGPNRLGERLGHGP